MARLPHTLFIAFSQRAARLKRRRSRTRHLPPFTAILHRSRILLLLGRILSGSPRTRHRDMHSTPLTRLLRHITFIATPRTYHLFLPTSQLNPAL